jgi:hypothetical protein
MRTLVEILDLNIIKVVIREEIFAINLSVVSLNASAVECVSFYYIYTFTICCLHVIRNLS